MLTNALKDGLQMASNPFAIAFEQPFGINFAMAWQAIAPEFFRSIYIVAISVVFITTFGMLSAYSFARLDFPLKRLLFNVVFALLLVPGFLTLIPLFLEIKNMNLLNTSWGLILPYIAGGQAFAIFVFRTFITAIPNEIFEAGRIDGANDLQMFTRLVVPLSVPVMVTIALLNINGLWGDYVLPSLILDPSHSTVAVAIANFQPPQDSPSLNAGNMQLAAFTISSIPIAVLFLFLMRYFVAGLTSGSVKM
jgi:ABC-type glycerol-3-phosphate transport system permease component